MAEEKEGKKTASVYFRGVEEVEAYGRIKEDARVAGSIDRSIRSFSEYAKQLLRDPFWPLKQPTLFLRFAGLAFWGPYDKVDTMIKVLGGVPDRDIIEEEGKKMTSDELMTGLRTHRKMRRLLDLYEEVWSELYKDKMKEQHGVDVDEIQL